MRAIAGWIIIGVAFCAISMALLWPIFLLLRRFNANSGRLLWAYAAATAACSSALWYLIPFAIHELFGRAAP
jgi:hypothetical protein